MAERLTDTPPEIEKLHIAGFRATPVWRKLQMVSDLTVATRMFALSGIRERYRGASPAELQRRLATLVLGSALATKVYGSEPGPPKIR